MTNPLYAPLQPLTRRKNPRPAQELEPRVASGEAKVCKQCRGTTPGWDCKDWFDVRAGLFCCKGCFDDWCFFGAKPR